MQSIPQIRNQVISIKDVEVLSKADDNRKSHAPVVVGGDRYNTTPRFWNSLFSRYGFNNQFFKYFSHDEVFDRIHKCEKNDKVRICIEKSVDKEPLLLAVSNPSKPVPDLNELFGLLSDYDGERITYSNGELSSLHSPRIGGSSSIGGDLFHNKFSVQVPIDGYGGTSLYLAMLRQVCSNGAIAMSKAFRQTLQLGKADDSVMPTLVRALDSYNNDEGFHALRQRLEASTKSWASIYDQAQLYKLLIKMHLNDELVEDCNPEAVLINKLVDQAGGPRRVLADDRVINNSPILSSFHQLTGDTTLLYGIANSDAMSIKKQKNLPVKCTVYDLINFATEVGTHHSNPEGQRRIQGWFGTTVSSEYDLENTKEMYGDFADFHMGKKLASGVSGSEFAFSSAE